MSRRRTASTRPWGTDAWVWQLEEQVGRPLLPRTGGWPKGRSRKALATY